jgi:hypothetical protein
VEAQIQYALKFAQNSHIVGKDAKVICLTGWCRQSDANTIRIMSVNQIDLTLKLDQ